MLYTKCSPLFFLKNVYGSLKKLTTKEASFPSRYEILPEFNIQDLWQEGMNWDDFQKIRTNLQRPELFRYLNKLKAQDLILSYGFQPVPTFLGSLEKISMETLRNALKNRSTYVLKPVHMCRNQGPTRIKDSINLKTQKNWSLEMTLQVANQFLETPSNSDEWALQNMPKGFLIQEFIDGQKELKIQTIWGKAQEVTYLDGEKRLYSNYSIDGTLLRGKDPLPKPLLEILPEALRIAEKISTKTDALRVDMFYDPHKKKLYVNELEIRSASHWCLSDHFVDLLTQGYKRLVPGTSLGHA